MRNLVLPAIFRAIDQMTAPVRRMAANVVGSAGRMNNSFALLERRAGRLYEGAKKMGRNAAVAGALISAPLIVAARDATKFEDKLADVGKTTGMQGKALEKLGDDVLKMSLKTRTSADDLLKIAEIGGQLGVPKEELNAFTESVNQFNVALGADFAGGVEEASSSIGKIKNLFKETRDVKIAESIRKAGSAINELGAIGAGTSANIADFTLRIGALPDALKPALEKTLALGTYFEEMGLDAQIASGGLTDFLKVAGQRLGSFAKQIGISSREAKDLLKNDPSLFAQRFAASFQGVAPEVLSQKLKKLGIGSQETLKVIGALGSGLKRVSELEKVASASFKAGTSLQDEYNKKNNTTAAQAERARNTLHYLSVTVGQALLPVLRDVGMAVVPVIEGLAKWTRENPGTVKTIGKIVLGLGAFLLAVSAVSYAVAGLSRLIYVARAAMIVYNVAVGLSALLTNGSALAIRNNVVAFGAYKFAVGVATVATRIWNAVLNMNPIGLIITGLVLAAGVIYAYTRAVKTSTVAERLNNEVKNRAFDKSVDQRVEANMLFKTLRSVAVGSDEYNKTLVELERLQPGIIDKYRLQEGALKDINRAEKELIGNIMKRARTEARGELMKEKFKRALTLENQAQQFSQTSSGSKLENAIEKDLRDKAAALYSESDMLAQQQVTEDRQAVNSQKEINTTNTEQSEVLLKFDMSGLPSWMMPPTVNGKSGNAAIVPSVTSTR